MRMTDVEISKALRIECYLDDVNEPCGGYRDLIPLLKVLRYKALHSDNIYTTAEDAPAVDPMRISPMYWIR